MLPLPSTSLYLYAQALFSSSEISFGLVCFVLFWTYNIVYHDLHIQKVWANVRASHLKNIYLIDNNCHSIGMYSKNNS